jgi:hypothetical protein
MKSRDIVSRILGDRNSAEYLRVELAKLDLYPDDDSIHILAQPEALQFVREELIAVQEALEPKDAFCVYAVALQLAGELS